MQRKMRIKITKLWIRNFRQHLSHGLQQWKNERDQEQEQEQVVQDRLELDAVVASQRRESVLALGTGAALARSGSANTQPADTPTHAITNPCVLAATGQP